MPLAQRDREGKVTWGKSQWKSGDIPGRFRVENQQGVHLETFHRPVDICKMVIIDGENRFFWPTHSHIGRRAAENRREPAVRGSENAREAARQPGGAFALRKALPGIVAGRWSTTATGRLLDSREPCSYDGLAVDCAVGIG